MMVKVISTENQMVNALKLTTDYIGKDTKTMHEVRHYRRMVSRKVNNKKCYTIYGTLYVTFFTNNKCERCYKYYQEVELHDFTKCQTFYIYKKKQVEPTRVMTWNDSDRINASAVLNITCMVENEFNKLNK